MKDTPTVPFAIPTARQKPTSELKRKLRCLRMLRPTWSIDVRAQEGEVCFELFVYARETKRFDDLLDIRTVTFPTVEGTTILTSPSAWLDVQIATATRPNVPAGLA